MSGNDPHKGAQIIIEAGTSAPERGLTSRGSEIGSPRSGR